MTARVELLIYQRVMSQAFTAESILYFFDIPSYTSHMQTMVLKYEYQFTNICPNKITEFCR